MIGLPAMRAAMLCPDRSGRFGVAHYLVTGGSSGIGEALALELGRRGHTLGLIARSADKLERVAEAVRAAGGKAAWATADVTDREATVAAVRQLEETLGPADCVVANAGGGGGPTTARKADAARIAADMRLNYEGTVNVFSAVLPAMIERGHGHIAAVASIAAYRGVPPGGGYSAAKAAVNTLLEAWAAELRGTGVAVTTINPGFVSTPLNANAKFKMPFLIPVERAAKACADGLERRKRYVVFPWQMWLLSHLWRPLPWWIFEPAVAAVTPRPDRFKKRAD
jgi:short-subunit dehydrogenase